MRNTAGGVGLGRLLAKRLYPMTLAIGFLISVGLPVTYYLIESNALRRTATIHVQNLSEKLQALVVDAPGLPTLWKYRTDEHSRILRELLSWKDVTIIRVFDEMGQPVVGHERATAKVGAWLVRYGPRDSAPIVFDGRVIGTVQVEVSQGRLLAVTLALLLLSTTVGAGLAVLVYSFPVKVVRGMEGQIQDLLEAQERRIKEAGQLFEIAQATGSTIDFRKLFPLLARKTAQACGVDRCTIFVLEGEQVIPVVSQFADGRRDEEMWGAFKALGAHRVEEVPILAATCRERQPVVASAGSELIPATWRETFGMKSLLALPLVVGAECIGAMHLDYTDAPHPFSEDQIRLASTIASQAAIAIEKSQLYERLTVKNEHLQELFEIARQATVSLTLSDLLPALVKAAAGFVGHDAASIRLLDASGTVLTAVANHGLSERFAARGDVRVHEGVAGIVVTEGRPLIVEDVATDARYLHGEAALAEGIRSLAIAPLRSRDRNIGTLCTYSRTPRRYSDVEVELLARFANVAAVAIENAKLYEDAQTRAARMHRLSELSQLMTSTLDAQQVLDFVARVARDLLRCDLARLWVVDPQEPDTVGLVSETRGEGPGSVQMSRRFVTGQGVAGWVMEHKQAYYCPNLVEDPLFVNKEWARTCGYVSMFMVPMLIGDRALGTLAVMTQAPRVFSNDERELLELFAAKAAIAIENARLYTDARAQTKALQEKNAELDSFVYVVSHDLKSPLVAIQGMASMLEADHAERLDARGKRYLERIGANVEQMERLIADLLALSRIGREARPPERIAVNELVDELLLELAERIRARDVKVTCGELGTVVAVRTQMFQIWSNLLSNAVKYLGDAPTPAVEIGCADLGEAIEYWVRDNGIGIDPAYHAQVFELFQQLREVEAEGTGVGLAIVKKIVELAGGRIWVESEAGKGTTFRFTWPKVVGERSENTHG
jgi:GAF domain-containing protein